MGLAISLAATSALAGGNADTAARIDEKGSRIVDFGADLRIELALTRPVSWRVHTLDAPRRLVLELDGVDLSQAELATIVASDGISDLRAMPRPGGWQRIVLTLTVPLRIETAGLTGSESGAALKLQLAPTTAAEFSRGAGRNPGTALIEPLPARLASSRAP